MCASACACVYACMSVCLSVRACVVRVACNMITEVRASSCYWNLSQKTVSWPVWADCSRGVTLHAQAHHSVNCVRLCTPEKQKLEAAEFKFITDIANLDFCSPPWFIRLFEAALPKYFCFSDKFLCQWSAMLIWLWVCVFSTAYTVFGPCRVPFAATLFSKWFQIGCASTQRPWRNWIDWLWLIHLHSASGHTISVWLQKSTRLNVFARWVCVIQWQVGYSAAGKSIPPTFYNGCTTTNLQTVFCFHIALKVRSFSHFLFLRHRIMCWPGPLPKG